MNKHLNKIELRLEKQEYCDGEFMGFSVYIDGMNLLDKVKEYESRFDDEYARPGAYIPNYSDWFLDHFKHKKAKNVPVFVSPMSMHEDDWDLSMSYKTKDGAVEWYGFHQTHRDDWDYSNFPTFIFNEEQYNKELAKVIKYVELEELQILVNDIVEKAQSLKDKHTDELSAPVNYACIFAHNQAQYDRIGSILKRWGELVHETETGFIYKIPALETSAGKLHLLKLRKPDSSRPQIGDADFTVSNYSIFKEKYLSRDGFKLIERPEMEMIELKDPKFNVLVYFSFPTLEKVLEVRR